MFNTILVFLRLSVLELWTDTRQNGHVTLWAWGYTLEDTAPVSDAGRRGRSVCQVWSSWALQFRRYRSLCASV